jgi:hypothetical protein
MPLYELRRMFKDVALNAMTQHPQDRVPPAHELIESFGGKLHHYYFMLGAYDGLAIVEFPIKPPWPQPACARARPAASSGSGHTRPPLWTKRRVAVCRVQTAPPCMTSRKERNHERTLPP